MREIDRYVLIRKVEREIRRQRIMGQGTQRFNRKELKAVFNSLSEPVLDEKKAIYNWLSAHIKIEDLKTHPEWIALKQLLGVQE